MQIEDRVRKIKYGRIWFQFVLHCQFLGYIQE